MSILVVLAHPHPGSFNHAIAETCLDALHSTRRQVVFHDLYHESFDPVMPHAETVRDAPLEPAVAAHCRELASADGIVVIHPNWWGQPPAILKGWVDRIVRPDVAYRFLEGDDGEGVPEGLLSARAALVFNTANTPPLREREVFGDPLESLWSKCIFGLCGVPRVERRTFTVVVTSSEERRRQWLTEVRDLVTATFPPL